MGIFQAIFGICETKPLDTRVWCVKEDEVLIKLDEADALKSDGAVYLKGQGLATPVLVVHLGNDYCAFTNRCRHGLGRKLDLVPGKNKLRCCSLGHSEYDFNGNVIKGPATESITKYAVCQREGDLVISLSQTAVESTEEKEKDKSVRSRSTNIIDIEGIGPTYAEKLRNIDLKTVEALLEKGATRKGREELEKCTGIGHALILEWVNLADLFRVKGIGEEYSDLLEEAGVDTVKELAQRNAANLHIKLEEVNEKKKLVRRTPTLDMVEDWIEQSKKLPRIVEY